MVSEMPKVKITVLKRTVHQDLIDEYLEDKYRDMGPCDCFAEGQEFVIEDQEALSQVPDGFCAWAWADIRNDIYAVAVGGEMPGFKRRGTAIAGCTDWLRPVIFKVERMNNG